MQMYRIITMDYACELDKVKKELGTDSYNDSLDNCADLGRIEGNPTEVWIIYKCDYWYWQYRG